MPKYRVKITRKLSLTEEGFYDIEAEDEDKALERAEVLDDPAEMKTVRRFVDDWDAEIVED